MYIHQSLNDPKFLADKKLNLLKNNIITQGQFINLIQLNDPYTIIGPAILDKSKISEFILQWKEKQDTITPLQDAFVHKITQNDIINNLENLNKIFPQIKNLTLELKAKLLDAQCPICLKNKYIILILLKIKDLYQDGRDLSTQKNFIEQVLYQYFPFANKLVNYENIEEFDITWIKPDSLIALGEDLILGLTNCFECAKKHITRAKILFEEWHQKYPEHGSIMYNQFTEANRDIEQGYLLFWDSIGQLDMASSELIGQLIGLNQDFSIQIINLANDIRKARILFQQNSNNIPDFAKLRLNIQKLQNLINKFKQ